MDHIEQFFKEGVPRKKLPEIFPQGKKKDKDRGARGDLVQHQIKGYNIANFQDKKGYRLVSDDEMLKYCAQEKRRGYSSVFKADRIESRILGKQHPPDVIPVKAHFRHIKKKPKDENQISFL